MICWSFLQSATPNKAKCKHIIIGTHRRHYYLLSCNFSYYLLAHNIYSLIFLCSKCHGLLLYVGKNFSWTWYSFQGFHMYRLQKLHFYGSSSVVTTSGIHSSFISFPEICGKWNSGNKKYRTFMMTTNTHGNILDYGIDTDLTLYRFFI